MGSCVVLSLGFFSDTCIFLIFHANRRGQWWTETDWPSASMPVTSSYRVALWAHSLSILPEESAFHCPDRISVKWPDAGQSRESTASQSDLQRLIQPWVIDFPLTSFFWYLALKLLREALFPWAPRHAAFSVSAMDLWIQLCGLIPCTFFFLI